MKITKYFGIDGAKQAKGITVIVDVLRASATSAYLLDKGIEKIFVVATAEEAFAYKKDHPEWILIGEDYGIKIEGFDYNNSPFEISQLDNLNGKTVIFRSSFGTQGIVNAVNADKIILGTYCTCGAIINYIKKNNYEVVSVVSMDKADSEDDLFADYFISKLNNKEVKPIEEIIVAMKEIPNSWKFLDADNEKFSKEDFDLCLKLDNFDFIPILKNGCLVKEIV